MPCHNYPKIHVQVKFILYINMLKISNKRKPSDGIQLFDIVITSIFNLCFIQSNL